VVPPDIFVSHCNYSVRWWPESQDGRDGADEALDGSRWLSASALVAEAPGCLDVPRHSDTLVTLQHLDEQCSRFFGITGRHDPSASLDADSIGAKSTHRQFPMRSFAREVDARARSWCAPASSARASQVFMPCFLFQHAIKAKKRVRASTTIPMSGAGLRSYAIKGAEMKSDKSVAVVLALCVFGFHSFTPSRYPNFPHVVEQAHGHVWRSDFELSNSLIGGLNKHQSVSHHRATGKRHNRYTVPGRQSGSSPQGQKGE
jgi:hypothetical protein